MSVLGAVAFALFAALFARVWFLQVINEQDFVAQAEGNRERTLVELAPRGRILDINNKVLVDNRASIQVTIDKETIITEVNKDDRPALFLDLAKEISATGRLTKVSEIETAFASDQYGPFAEVPVVGDVTEELQLYLAENSQRFPGVHTRVVTVREYPYGTAAAHLLGYVGALNEGEFEASKDKPKNYQINDQIGKSGIELFYEDHLRGTPGTSVIEVDKYANVLEVLEYTAPVAGSDIRLTIDIDLQIMAEQELKAGLEAARLQGPQTSEDDPAGIPYTAPAGAVVLLNPQDGTVRAMASYPTYDPSTFVGGISTDAFLELSDESGDLPLLNRAIQGEYAPGSTFKPFTAYAALDTGLLGPRGVLEVRAPYNDTGVYFIPTCPDDPSCRFQNAGQKAYGAVDLRRALTVSSDTYFYNLAANFDRLQFDRDSVQQAAKLFGFGAPTGLTLPNENAGYIPTPEGRQARHEANPEAFPFPDWRTGDTIVTSIGQGDVLATPIQLATAYGALANGGDIYAPNLAAAVLDPLTGETSLEFKPRRQRTIYYPPQFSEPIADGLRDVPTLDDGSESGTAFQAFSGVNFPHASWPSAGKTGTSEKQGQADFALYVGYGPLPEAEYVGVAILEEAGFGGNVAAPIIAKLFKAIATDSVEPALTQAEVDEQDRIAFQAAQAGLSIEEFLALENPEGSEGDVEDADAGTEDAEAGEG